MKVDRAKTIAESHLRGARGEVEAGEGAVEGFELIVMLKTNFHLVPYS